MAAAPAMPGLPPPPRIVRYVCTLDCVMRIQELAAARGQPVVVFVTGCKPLQSAGDLFDELTLRETQGGWHVLGMPELEKLRERAQQLLDQKQNCMDLIGDMEATIEEYGAVDVDVDAAAERSVRASKLLGLDGGEDAPQGFTYDMVGQADEARRLARERLVKARGQLCALADHARRHMLRRLNKELASKAPTGAEAPSEDLWQEIMNQSMEDPMPDSVADEAEEEWAPSPSTSSDSDDDHHFA